VAKRFKASRSQATFLRSKARYIGFVGGVGSGKTATGAIKSIQKIQDGEDGIIVAPDFPQLQKSTFPEFVKWAPMSYCTNAHLDHPFTQKKQLKFNINGKTVTVYYGGIEKEQGWAGPNVNWAWFDEAARKRTRKAFDILAARIRVGEDPQLWCTTTPMGVNHWLYEVFVQGVFDETTKQVLRDMGWDGPIAEYVNAPTSENAHNLDPFHVAMLNGMYSGKFRAQELGGEFVRMEGAVWDTFDSTVGGPNVNETAEYVPSVPVEWWIDDGFTENHPRCILFAQVVPPDINVFDEYYAVGELPEVSITNAIELHGVPDVAYVDSSAAELRNRLWNTDIDTVGATHNVEDGIKRAGSWFMNGSGDAHLRIHPRCSTLVKELGGHLRNEKTGKPIKDKDHGPDALRYGVWFKDREAIWSGDSGSWNSAQDRLTTTESPVIGPGSPEFAEYQAQIASGKLSIVEAQYLMQLSAFERGAI